MKAVAVEMKEQIKDSVEPLKRVGILITHLK
jgi:hypothetical protein